MACCHRCTVFRERIDATSEKRNGRANHTWQEACWEVNLNTYPAVLNRSRTVATTVLSSICEKCGTPLTLHQPNVDQADRLLGTCEECKSWYVTSGWPMRLVYLPLPDAQRFDN